jgi:hypothetical protein
MVDMAYLLSLAKRMRNSSNNELINFPSSAEENSFQSFDSSSKPPPSSLPQTLLIEDQFWAQFDKEDILEELSQLKASRSLVFLNSKLFEGEEKLEREFYHGTLHKIEGLEGVESFEENNFKIFGDNPFVPKNAKYQEIQDYKASGMLVSSSLRGRVYYKYNSVFKVPKTFFKLRLVYSNSSINLFGFLKVFLEVALVNLANLAALLQRALGKIDLLVEETGLVIAGVGFTEKIGDIVRNIVGKNREIAHKKT